MFLHIAFQGIFSVSSANLIFLANKTYIKMALNMDIKHCWETYKLITQHNFSGKQIVHISFKQKSLSSLTQ